VSVPPSTAPAVPVPPVIASVTLEVAALSRFPRESSTVTTTGGVMALPARTSVGCTVKDSLYGAGTAPPTSLKEPPVPPSPFGTLLNMAARSGEGASNRLAHWPTRCSTAAAKLEGPEPAGSAIAVKPEQLMSWGSAHGSFVSFWVSLYL